MDTHGFLKRSSSVSASITVQLALFTVYSNPSGQAEGTARNRADERRRVGNQIQEIMLISVWPRFRVIWISVKCRQMKFSCPCFLPFAENLRLNGFDAKKFWLVGWFIIIYWINPKKQNSRLPIKWRSTNISSTWLRGDLGKLGVLWSFLIIIFFLYGHTVIFRTV